MQIRQVVRSVYQVCSLGLQITGLLMKLDSATSGSLLDTPTTEPHEGSSTRSPPSSYGQRRGYPLHRPYKRMPTHHRH